jgi:uncharacterized protein (DUF433 family)/DNA-binding transcriptional MerR regulator
MRDRRLNIPGLVRMRASTSPPNDWRRRIRLPHYQVREAARYAKISPQTVIYWQKGTGPLLVPRDAREALSYVQLIEIAVVSKMRNLGVSLKRIRDAREYVGNTLKSEFPFAEYRFKTDGRRLFMNYAEIVGMRRGKDILLRPDQQGQLAWETFIGQLQEFEYERDEIVIRWHVAGLDSSVAIDPRFSFGAPTVKGVPTWAIKGRWTAGELPEEIEDDLGIGKKEIIDALSFEGIEDEKIQQWLH